ncbi:hypothetical protein IC619_014830 [Hazenella sp. IB182353]|uniref:hypothetical protein n=1 Tax=Polycladospora coralii TaxID=2771432 RepID=UPI001747801F|nr:hypothetical protein [Polycladospora coralii]MBS7531747.1 hypothetical protein [Polycladospora coralii]
MRKKLKIELVNPYPEESEFIRSIVSKFVRDNESFYADPVRGYIDGEYYFLASFFVGNMDERNNNRGFLAVREDGYIPNKKKAEEVLKLLGFQDSCLKGLCLTIGKDRYESSMDMWHDIESILKNMKLNVDHTLAEDYQMYLSLPRVMFETQNEIYKLVERGTEILKEQSTHFTITPEMGNELEYLFNTMMSQIGKQFEIWHDTQESRKRFIKQMRKRISIFNVPKRYELRKLAKYNKAILVEGETKKMHDEVMADITRQKASAEGQKKQLESLRNPE